MAIGQGMRTAWRRIDSARRAAGRLLPGARTPPPPPDVPAEPVRRPGVARPARDDALLTRLGRWRGRAGEAVGDPGPDMSAEERAGAMRDLRGMRSRLDGEQAQRIDAALAAGTVDVRRLSPADGHLWEMPGLRVFAIVGVQAFTVEDPLPGDPGVEETA